ncbi:MAG: hypothetical protein E3K37_00345 [Candidatus Kuenenia sp.]|nr:hypothetical protein [Candidatus Kuenenia hertensis]
MKQRFNLFEVISILKESEFISRVEIKTIDEIHESGIYKVRCSLIPSKYKLERRFVKTQEQILYSYQLFSNTPIVRWDNSPHYPKIKTHPHHFHADDGVIKESELTGNVVPDIKKILYEITKVIVKYEC